MNFFFPIFDMFQTLAEIFKETEPRCTCSSWCMITCFNFQEFELYFLLQKIPELEWNRSASNVWIGQCIDIVVLSRRGSSTYGCKWQDHTSALKTKFFKRHVLLILLYSLKVKEEYSMNYLKALKSLFALPSSYHGETGQWQKAKWDYRVCWP